MREDKCASRNHCICLVTKAFSKGNSLLFSSNSLLFSTDGEFSLIWPVGNFPIANKQKENNATIS